MKIEQEREYVSDLKGKEWVDKYNNLFEDMINRRNELSKLLSNYDLQRQDILHYIEMKKCDAIMSAKLMKKLKEVTCARRVVKEEYCSLNSLTANLKRNKYKNNQEYTFKTNVIIDLLEEDEKGENK
jgi:hypothetical protein